MIYSLKEHLQSLGIMCQENLDVSNVSTNFQNPTRFSTDPKRPGDDAGWAVLFNNNDGSQVIKAGCYREGIEESFSVTKGSGKFKPEPEIERVKKARSLNNEPMMTAGARYLINRGLKESVIRQCSDDIRVMDNVPYWITDKNKNYKVLLNASVIASLIKDDSGELQAWHKIYTGKDGEKPQQLIDEERTTKKVKNCKGVDKLEDASVKVMNAIPGGTYENALGVTEGIENAIAMRQLGFDGEIRALSSTAGFKSFIVRTDKTIYLSDEGDAASDKAKHNFYTNNSDSEVLVFHYGKDTDANDYILEGNNTLPKAVPYMKFKQGAFQPPAEILSDEEIEAYEDEYESFPHVTFNQNGDITKVSATIENVEVLLKRAGIEVRYNDMSHKMEIEFTRCSDSEKEALGYNADSNLDTMMTDILNHAELVRMPLSRVPEIVQRVAMKNRYHPVVNWIESKPWDGKSRWEEILSTVEVEPEEEQLKRIFFKRWFVSAVGALYEKNGIGAEGTIVLSGKHGKGKSRWIRSLVPDLLRNEVTKESAILDPKDKDSVNQTVTKWLVELGEVDATFRKADIAELKAFLTKSVDEYRLPYARFESRFARRTVFLASINEPQFLMDQSGNRRFWSISPTALNHAHDVDLQQLWAEVKTWYEDGEQWWLNDDERRLLNLNDTKYRVKMSIEEIFNEAFYDEDGQLREQVHKDPSDITKGFIDFEKGLTVVECLKALGMRADDRMKQRELSAYFGHILDLECRRTSRGQKWMMMKVLPGFEEKQPEFDFSNVKPFNPNKKADKAEEVKVETVKDVTGNAAVQQEMVVMQKFTPPDKLVPKEQPGEVSPDMDYFSPDEDFADWQHPDMGDD